MCMVDVGMPKIGPDKKPVLGPDGKPVIVFGPKLAIGCNTAVAEGMVVPAPPPMGAIRVWVRSSISARRARPCDWKIHSRASRTLTTFLPSAHSAAVARCRESMPMSSAACAASWCRKIPPKKKH